MPTYTTDTCPVCDGVMDIALYSQIAPVAKAGLLAEGKAKMVCLACGYHYPTADDAANAFEQNGCPQCGSMDMDIGVPPEPPIDTWHHIDDDWLESAYESRFEYAEA